jgi:hypothetical protein
MDDRLNAAASNAELNKRLVVTVRLSCHCVTFAAPAKRIDLLTASGRKKFSN